MSVFHFAQRGGAQRAVRGHVLGGEVRVEEVEVEVVVEVVVVVVAAVVVVMQRGGGPAMTWRGRRWMLWAGGRNGGSGGDSGSGRRRRSSGQQSRGRRLQSCRCWERELGVEAVLGGRFGLRWDGFTLGSGAVLDWPLCG